MSSTEAPRLRALIQRSAPAVRTEGVQGQPDDQEHCDLCGLPVPPAHRHVVDLDKRTLLCACRACALLFDHDGAGGGHYRLVPDRCRRLDGFRLDDLGWRALGLPVEMAFFLRTGGRVTAFYPSPAGVTESELELDAWSEIEADNPALAEMRDDVEALLVNRAGDAREAFVVGVDECYRLVAVIREHWHGFGGGDDVWRAIDAFFGGLRARARETE